MAFKERLNPKRRVPSVGTLGLRARHAFLPRFEDRNACRVTGLRTSAWETGHSNTKRLNSTAVNYKERDTKVKQGDSFASRSSFKQ